VAEQGEQEATSIRDALDKRCDQAEAALKEAHERRCETMAMANHLQQELKEARGLLERLLERLAKYPNIPEHPLVVEARAYLDRVKA
jgi:F0F1-type ATP synthase membrane subunit b/b'